MHILVEKSQCGLYYNAFDTDKYDGAPDGDITVGQGDCISDAVNDLLEQYIEMDNEKNT
jgi:hypothetical protein